VQPRKIFTTLTHGQKETCQEEGKKKEVVTLALLLLSSLNTGHPSRCFFWPAEKIRRAA
jgi:hypothetical protein